MVMLKAIEISKDPKYEIPAGQFKASNHWCQRFMKRNGLSLRQKTTLAQRLPPDYEEKIVPFQWLIIKQRRAHSYQLHLVANMDESPIQFDMPSDRTVSKTGEKTVKIQTTGNEKESPNGCLDMCRRWFQAETAGYFQTQNQAENYKKTWSCCCRAAEGMDG